MAKVNIGLRGWRFEEDEVFDDDGTVKPLGTMDEDTRARVLRLTERLTDPCDACWLEFGQDDVTKCTQAEVIYGEPRGEVILCREHEADFVYWFRQVAEEAVIGTVELQDAFHAWFHDGGRAPAEFASLEHVDSDPDAVPEAPDPYEEMPGLEDELAEIDDEELEDLDVDLEDLDV